MFKYYIFKIIFSPNILAFSYQSDHKRTPKKFIKNLIEYLTISQSSIFTLSKKLLLISSWKSLHDFQHNQEFNYFGPHLWWGQSLIFTQKIWKFSTATNGFLLKASLKWQMGECSRSTDKHKAFPTDPRFDSEILMNWK